MATCWRWPPDIVPTSARTSVIVTARFSSSSCDGAPCPVSSSERSTGQPTLLDGRGRGSRRRRGCRRERGPGGRSRSRAPPRRSAARSRRACSNRSGRSRRMDARDHLDERRLACAVVPDERHDLAGEPEVPLSSACTGPKLLLTSSSARTSPFVDVEGIARMVPAGLSLVVGRVGTLWPTPAGVSLVAYCVVQAEGPPSGTDPEGGPHCVGANASAYSADLLT